MKYASGISFKAAHQMDREGIEKALKGQMFTGEDAAGNPVWGEIDSKITSAKEIILGAYDEAVFQAAAAMRSAEALETVAEKYGFSVKDHMAEIMRETLRLSAEENA